MLSARWSKQDLLIRGKRCLTLFASVFILVIIFPIPPTFGNEDPIIAIYLEYPNGADEDEIRELQRLEQHIVGQLEFFLPTNFDEPETVTQEQIYKSNSIQDYVRENPRIETLVHLKILPKYPNGDWSFKFSLYQKKVNDETVTIEKKKCRNSHCVLVSPYGREEIKKIAQRIASSLFPSEIVAQSPISSKIVFATCFEVSSTIKGWLKEALETEAIVLPKELQVALGPVMRERGYIFDGLSPSDARLCVTAPQDANPPGDYQYEIEGVITIREEGADSLTVKIFFIGKDHVALSIVDQKNKSLEVSTENTENLDVFVAEFIRENWDHTIGEDR